MPAGIAGYRPLKAAHSTASLAEEETGESLVPPWMKSRDGPLTWVAWYLGTNIEGMMAPRSCALLAAAPVAAHNEDIETSLALAVEAERAHPCMVAADSCWRSLTRCSDANGDARALTSEWPSVEKESGTRPACHRPRKVRTKWSIRTNGWRWRIRWRIQPEGKSQRTTRLSGVGAAERPARTERDLRTSPAAQTTLQSTDCLVPGRRSGTTEGAPALR